MSKYRVLVAITRFEEITVTADSKDEVEFHKDEVPDYKHGEKIEILNKELMEE
jgi:hypothetical protein